MAATRLNPQGEEDHIFDIVQSGNNFLLSGGAGSGKTYSLVQIIQKILTANPQERVAVITFTNAATNEIKSRIENSNVFISTIHEFLWNNIKPFQREMKLALNELAQIEIAENALIANENDKKNQFKDFDETILGNNAIEYKGFKRLNEGIISHDEVLAIANHLFKKYTKLCAIVKDKYHYIFLDEYQDTAPLVIEILLKHLQEKKSQKKNIIGLFGDAMQSIYDEGVGNLDDGDANSITSYIKDKVLQKVEKRQNRRNPRLVYELGNQLRRNFDGLNQIHSDDPNAPNMVREQINPTVKEGSIKFYYSPSSTATSAEFLQADDHLKKLKKTLGWSFNNAKTTKELNLTHNLIAAQVGFESLMEVYNNNKILDYKNRVKDFISEHGLALNSFGKTFGEVVDALEEEYKSDNATLLRIHPTRTQATYINNNPILFNNARSQPVEAFFKLYTRKEKLISDFGENEDGTQNSQSQRDALIEHLFKIQSLISLTEKQNYNAFMRKTDFKITKHEDRKKLQNFIDILKNNSGSQTIGAVINDADKYGLCRKDDNFYDFIKNKSFIFESIKTISYSQFIKLYDYVTGGTSFSTQHKTKGSEFDNVLVILDNRGFNKYNFGNLFDKEKEIELAKRALDNPTQTNTNASNSYKRISKRTARLFYVCCTRAKENLACFYHQPSNAILTTAKEWFGEDNVIDITTI